MREKELKKKVFEWDTESWSKAFELWDEALKNITPGKALELGGRRGGPSLYLASKGFDVLCTDINKDFLDQARAFHQKEDVSDRVKYESLDALNIHYENEFDVVILKYILGGIDRDNKYYKKSHKKILKQIHKALKPGGYFLFAENLKRSKLHLTAREKLRKWVNTWRYLDHRDLDDYFEPFSKVKIKRSGFAGAFGLNESMKNAFGKIDGLLLNSITPKSWKYIAYGYAKK
jgi:SAM-dependent methyltransferase